MRMYLAALDLKHFLPLGSQPAVLLGKVNKMRIFCITLTTLSVTWINELISSMIGNRFGLLRQSNSMPAKRMVIVILGLYV